MKTSKRFLSLALALVLCLGLLPTAALAAGNDFIIQDGVLKGYRGADVNVVVPDGVTEIGESAFRENTKVQTVTLPDSVKKLESCAFYGCTGLTGITIPGRVTEVGRRAFENCTGLKTVVIGNGLTTLPERMFGGCTALTDVTISEGVALIGERAFADCSALTGIAIPGSITEIGEGAFMGAGLTSLTIPGTVKHIAYEAFKNCKDLKELTICDGVERINVENFNFSYAFEGCTSLTDVVIPDSVTELGSGAFKDCTSLTSLTLSKGMTWLGNGTVEGCKSLETLVIPANIVDIDKPFNYFRSGKDDCPRLTIYGEANSAADLCAYENGVPFVVGLPRPAAAGPVPTSKIAYASTQTVQVDGKGVEFQCYALRDESGNDTNYIKLRDVANVLNGSAAQFNVGWDGGVTITTKQAYTPNGTEMAQNFQGDQSYSVNASPVTVNGAVAELEAITLTDANGGGYTYFKLRDLGEALGFNVSWSARSGIAIDSNRPYDPNN